MNKLVLTLAATLTATGFAINAHAQVGGDPATWELPPLGYDESTWQQPPSRETPEQQLIRGIDAVINILDGSNSTRPYEPRSSRPVRPTPPKVANRVYYVQGSHDRYGNWIPGYWKTVWQDVQQPQLIEPRPAPRPAPRLAPRPVPSQPKRRSKLPDWVVQKNAGITLVSTSAHDIKAAARTAAEMMHKPIGNVLHAARTMQGDTRKTLMVIEQEDGSTWEYELTQTPNNTSVITKRL